MEFEELKFRERKKQFKECSSYISWYVVTVVIVVVWVCGVLVNCQNYYRMANTARADEIIGSKQPPHSNCEVSTSFFFNSGFVCYFCLFTICLFISSVIVLTVHYVTVACAGLFKYLNEHKITETLKQKMKKKTYVPYKWMWLLKIDRMEVKTQRL